MTKARVNVYLWQDSYARLKGISAATGTPMIVLLDKAIAQLDASYQKEQRHAGR